jgi:YVTN family beta-propeller protein
MSLLRLALVLCVAGLAGAVAAATNRSTLLPSGWRIAAPAGPVATVGTLPEGLALTRDGTRILVVEGGTLPTELRILDAKTLAQRAAVSLRGAYGIPLVEPEGDGAWVAGANADVLFHVDLTAYKVDKELALPKGCWATAVTRVRSTLLAATCELTNRVVLADAATGAVRAAIDVGANPSAVVAAPGGTRLFVADWGERGIDVVDVASARRIARVGVGLHPEALALAPDGAHLYVANSDDDSLSIVDLRHLDAVPRSVPIRFGRTPAYGLNLDALAVAPDRRRLYAVAGAVNAVYAFAIQPGAALRRLGAIPTGWYPTAILPARDRLYVANDFGEHSRANPEYSLMRDQYGTGYIARTDVGSVRRLPVPDDAALREGELRVVRFAGSAHLERSAVVRAHGPIRHVIYIIKENRTYDQVFGDVRGADGDPGLVLFGEKVTPNEHAIVRRFGVFDRTFCDAQVSADGHTWSTGAIATDYVEKMWQADYAHPYRRPYYDFESPISPGRPHAGYVWDDALNARLAVRNYGEFVDLHGAWFFWKATPRFVAHTDERYAGYDLTVSDLTREAEWEREFRGFERSGDLPALEIVRLPNDHTRGTTPGALTPQAYVAQNDAALGKIVDVVSHSRFWRSTAIFVIEDDAQDGPDHVDEHRTTFLLASPYAKGGVQHAMYTTAGVLRTIELILGLPPMTTYDAHALPLYAAFTAKPDFRPYDALAPRIDIEARNTSAAYRAADSARLDFRHADAVDAATLNDILWHAVRGPRATPPPFGRFPS